MGAGCGPAPGAGERGAALLVVLLFCALLAGLAGIALQSATGGARAARVFLDEMQADELGRGAADAVAYRIVSLGPMAQRGGAFAIHLDRADIEVEYRSESARIDVNTAPAGLIASVLAAAGADAAEIAFAQNALAATRPATKTPPIFHLASADAGDSAPDATAAPPRGGARMTPYEHPVEAVQAWRLSPDVAKRVLPALTVANGTPKVDPVLADRLVLAALLGSDETRVDDYLQRRGQGFAEEGSALALLPLDAQPYAGFADVSAVRALVLVTVAHRFKRRYEIVLDPPSFVGEAPKVLSWRPLF